MILTLTPNPVVDRVIFVRGFRLGAVVRAEREVVTPSGKGVDASLVIRALGGTTVALGLSAGLTGRLFAELLDQWGVRHDFAAACGETRTAAVLVDLAVGQQSTISASTLTAGEQHLSLLRNLLERYVDQAWGLICGGSLPSGLPADSYACLLQQAREWGLVTLLDTSGEALRLGIEGLPHILKINRSELEGLSAGVPCVGAGRAEDVNSVGVTALVESVTGYLGKWASDALVVTLGKKGALAVTAEGSYHAVPPDVQVANTAGAGDALSGGLMLARSRGADWSTALALGTAAAASAVMNEGTAVCRLEQVEALLPLVRVDCLSPSGP